VSGISTIRASELLSRLLLDTTTTLPQHSTVTMLREDSNSPEDAPSRDVVDPLIVCTPLFEPLCTIANVSPLQRAHIYSLCTALGGASVEETGKYALGDDALACLKDLRRWLKLYDEKLNRYDVCPRTSYSNERQC